MRRIIPIITTIALCGIASGVACNNSVNRVFRTPAAGTGTDILPGPVSGSWTEAGSPYRILGDIYITRGSTLQIEPGVTVLFTGNYKLDNFGQINAVGTAEKRIVFTAENPELIASLNYGDPEGSGGWGGIRMQDPEVPATTNCANPDATLLPSALFPDDGKVYSYDPYLPQVFRYCDFEYANKLIAIDPSNTIYTNYGGALLFWYAYDITVDNCRFYRCQARSGGALCYALLADPDRVYITNSELRECSALGPPENSRGGALLAWNGWLQLENTEIIDCHTDGLGGGGSFNYVSVWLKNVTFSGNTADHTYTSEMGQADYFFGSQPGDDAGSVTVL